MSRAAVQQALDALEVMWRHFSSARLGEYTATDYATRNAAYAAIYQLRVVLAEPEQPVGINGLTEAETDASASVAGLANKPEQEPVAWMYDFLNPDNEDEVIPNWVTQNPADIERGKGFNVRPLYTASTPRKPVELSNDEIIKAGVDAGALEGNAMLPVTFARAVIAAYEAKQRGQE